MCGIAGIFSSKLSKDEQYTLTNKMLYEIRHRGPDNSSIWQSETVSLGHNRLSIIDLSDEANQPFHYLHLTTIFNGEIYNYLEIKKELVDFGYQFKTTSDTEVVLAAYHNWGAESVNRFMGMWALVIWDEKNKELFCSRDRFGIKPFYYIWDKGDFYFASEYKALKTLPNFDSTLNINQVYRGIQMGWVTYHDETYYKAIHQIPAASNLLIKSSTSSLEINKYWEIDFSKKIEASYEDKIELFRNAMIESVTMHLRSDVVVGACLSGGLDSSAIASIVGKFMPKTDFNTFTIFYDGKNDVDERPFAKEVTDLYPSLKPHYLQPSNINIEEDFNKIQYHQDTPLPGSSPISQYYVMKMAKEQKAVVLLDGQGSDEFLAGYLHSFYRIIGDQLMSFNPLNGIDSLNKFCEIQGFSAKEKYTRLAKSMIAGLFSENTMYQKEYRHAFPFLPNSNHDVFSLEKKNTSKLNGFLYHLMFTTSLPSLLHFEDRNSMAFSIESRVPFLDHRLVELAFSLSDDFKIKNGITKNILRESMDGILPNPIKNRMDKKGFVTPGEVKWLRGPLHFLMNDIIYSNLNMLDTKLCKKLIDEYVKGDNSNAKIVWRIVTLNHWLKNSK